MMPDRAASAREGPRARRMTVFGETPVKMKPVIAALSFLPVLALLERMPNAHGRRDREGLGVTVGVGLADGVGEAEGLGVSCGEEVEAGVGLGGGVGDCSGSAELLGTTYFTSAEGELSLPEVSYAVTAKK